MSKTHFPCWVCKGQGGEKEVVCDDGSGPYYPCGYCNGEGLIEIRGAVHRRNTVNKILGDIWCAADNLYVLGENWHKGEPKQFSEIERLLCEWFNVELRK